MELFDESMGESFSVDLRRLTAHYTEFKTASTEAAVSAEMLVGSSIAGHIGVMLGKFNREFEEGIVGEKKEAANALCMLWLVKHLKDMSHDMTKKINQLQQEYCKASNLKEVLAIQLLSKKEILVYVRSRLTSVPWYRSLHLF